MILYRLLLLCLIAIFSFNTLNARIVKDTIKTSEGDRIILSYDISYSGNRVTLRFNDRPQKKLGRINSIKYPSLNKVAVVFFDRTGNFSRDVFFSEMIPEAFMVPSSVNYEHSSDGYFLLHDEPTLSFIINGKTTIKVPIYLAYHRKKGEYTLFGKCKPLSIIINTSSSTKENANDKIVQQTITSTLETENDNTVAIKVLESVALAKSLLAETEKLPFSESLLDEISYLRQKKREVTDNELLTEITVVLSKYESKKASLEEKTASEQMLAQQIAEHNAKLEAEKIKAQNDSIVAIQQTEAKQENERNTWLIVGGIIIAILAFIGNQIFQHFRSVRNQKNMLNLQQSIANKAETEAKRQARNAIRSKSNRIAASTKRKVSEEVRRKIIDSPKGKSKNLSI